MLDRIPRSLVAPRVHGEFASLAILAVRFATGAFLVGVGMGKFTDSANELADFRHYGVPLPEVAVPLSGTIEMLAGFAIAFGFLVRPAAALVVVNLLVALLTAGVTDGGTFHLVVGPVVMLLMVVLVVSGAPAPSVDAKILRHLDRGTDAPVSRR
jgi:putative oxidoreductase